MTFRYFIECIILTALAFAMVIFIIWLINFIRIEIRETEIQRGTYKKVRHGHWINVKPNQRDLVKCSECGLFMDVGTNYCPKCGAKMDEVE